MDIRCNDVLAGQIKERCLCQLVADEAEARVGCVGSSILHGVPPRVHIAKKGASNLIPVCLGVLERGDSLADSLATNGKPGFRNPDGLSTDGGLRRAKGIVEESLVVGDSIGLSLLEVGVGVNADPVSGIDDGLVGSVDPRGPCVDMADGGVGERGAGNGITNLLHVFREGEGVSTRVLLVQETGGRDAVEILAADRDTSDETGEVGAILIDGGLDSLNLIGNNGFAGRGPDAEQKARLGLDSSWDSRDGIVGSSSLLWRQPC